MYIEKIKHEEHLLETINLLVNREDRRVPARLRKQGYWLAVDHNGDVWFYEFEPDAARYNRAWVDGGGSRGRLSRVMLEDSGDWRHLITFVAP